jgi:cyclophilin family peptidyl-prolyl cis-trans isomerase
MKPLHVIIPLASVLALTSCNREPAAEGLATPAKGPDRYRARFETTKGDFVVEAVRGWSPLGADRFHELVTSGYYNENRFFRVVPGFVVQWGLAADPALTRKWKTNIDDDPPGVSNTPGTVCFATAGRQTRTTQVFINFGDNSRLDSQGFSPFGKVTEGMGVVVSLSAEYGERPDQGRITSEGNAYLKAEFPNLDYIRKASIIP